MRSTTASAIAAKARRDILNYIGTNKYGIKTIREALNIPDSRISNYIALMVKQEVLIKHLGDPITYSVSEDFALVESLYPAFIESKQIDPESNLSGKLTFLEKIKSHPFWGTDPLLTEIINDYRRFT